MSAGLLLIALFTLYRASVSLRKVATLTGSIDFEDKGVRLSIHDLPLEIQPLVQALNTMLQRKGYRIAARNPRTMSAESSA